MKQKTATFVAVNTTVVDDGIKRAEDRLKKYLADDRPLGDPKIVNNAVVGKALGAFSWLLTNPVVQMFGMLNPMGILYSITIEGVSEAFEEELASTIEIPDLGELISIATGTLPELVEKEFVNLLRFTGDIVAKVDGVVKDPGSILEQLKELGGDLIWTALDAVKLVLEAVWEIFGKFLKGGLELIDGIWKIPMVTSIFEDMAGQVSRSSEPWRRLPVPADPHSQPFSLLNFSTYFLSIILNIVFAEQVLTGKSPWDVIGRPDLALQQLPDSFLDFRNLFNAMKSTSAGSKKVMTVTASHTGIASAVSQAVSAQSPVPSSSIAEGVQPTPPVASATPVAKSVATPLTLATTSGDSTSTAVRSSLLCIIMRLTPLQYAKWAYKHNREAFDMVATGARCISAWGEVIKTLNEVSSDAGTGEMSKLGKGALIVSLCCDVVSTAMRALALGYYCYYTQTYPAYGKEIEDQKADMVRLERTTGLAKVEVVLTTRQIAGYSTSLILNVVSWILTSLEASPKGGEGVYGAISGILKSVACILSTVLTSIIPDEAEEKGSGDKPNQTLKSVDELELAGAGLSVFASSCAIAAKKAGGDAKLVLGIAAFALLFADSVGDVVAGTFGK
jgi:hypothetical protein